MGFLRLLVNLVKFLFLASIVFICFIGYLGHEWQPSSYKGKFSKVFQNQQYQEFILDIENENGVLLIGKKQTGFENFLQSYITKTMETKNIKIRNPTEQQNLQLHTNKFIVDTFKTIKGWIMTHTKQPSLWIIDIRDFEQTPQFVKSVQSLKKKSKHDQLILLGRSSTQSIKGFKKFQFQAPTQQQIEQIIIQTEGNINPVHIENFFWFYNGNIDLIANTIDNYDVEDFYIQFIKQNHQYQLIDEEKKGLFEKICKQGEVKSELIKSLRLSRLVTFKEGKYYWSSAQAFIVYSGRLQAKCAKPKEFVSLSQEQRQQITALIDEQNRLQQQRLAALQKQKQQQGKKKKAKDSKKDKRDKKTSKVVQKQQLQQLQQDQQPQIVVKKPKRKQNTEKKVVKQPKEPKAPSKKLQQRRNKKSIDYQQDLDEQRDDKSIQSNEQADILNEYADQDEDQLSEIGEEVVQRRIRLAQKKTKKQQRQDLQELQAKIKNIKTIRKQDRNKRNKI